MWSQRGNLLAVPTDCPQRERVGWTGDLQIFIATAATNMAIAAFMQRWLANLRVEAAADGGVVPIIVPMPPKGSLEDPDPDGLFTINAAAGWGDVVTVAPWVLYQRYGDVGFLRDNYEAMAAWVEVQRRQAVEYLPARVRDAELSPEDAAAHEVLWNGVTNFGDWLTPSLSDSTNPDSIMVAPRRTGEIVGALFQGLSLDLIADTAQVLGKDEDARAYRERATRVRDAFAQLYLDGHGRLTQDLQGPYVLALALGFVPESQKAGAVAELVRLIHDNDDRLDTGFLSVPYLLDALWDNGERALARTLLWQSKSPSWLYEVDHGATTIWESWDAVTVDGEVGISSFNHYAFGCVDDWLFRRLAGLQIVEPAFKRSRIAPDLEGPLTSVTAGIDTPYGRLAVAWERTEQTSRLQITVPANTTGVLDLPAGWETDGDVELSSGTHHVVARRTADQPASSTSTEGSQP